MTSAIDTAADGMITFNGSGGHVPLGTETEMTKGMNLRDVLASREPSELREKLLGLAEPLEDGMGSPITIYCAQLVQAELQLQAIETLEKSSKRLEKLTVALIVLTLALIIFGIPPAFDVFATGSGGEGGHVS